MYVYADYFWTDCIAGFWILDEKLEQKRNGKAGLATTDYKHQRRLPKKFPGGSMIKVKPNCLELARGRVHTDYTS